MGVVIHPGRLTPPPQLWLEIDYIWTHPHAEPNEPPPVKALRSILKDDPKRFFAMQQKSEGDWEKTEQEAWKAKGKEPKPLETEEDQGEERCIRLCEEWLKEHGKQDRP